MKIRDQLHGTECDRYTGNPGSNLCPMGNQLGEGPKEIYLLIG